VKIQENSDFIVLSYIRSAGHQAKTRKYDKVPTLSYYRVFALRPAERKYNKVVTVSCYRVFALAPRGMKARQNVDFVVLSCFRLSTTWSKNTKWHESATIISLSYLTMHTS
jgi:hypothetical protein